MDMILIEPIMESDGNGVIGRRPVTEWTASSIEEGEWFLVHERTDDEFYQLGDCATYEEAKVIADRAAAERGVPVELWTDSDPFRDGLH